MARWRLTCSHYIKTVPPQVWEYKEVDQRTGKNVTKRFEVPTLLDPGDPSSWTNRDSNGNGEIVVAIEGKTTNSYDIIFEGPPTPDMLPLDAEAEEISQSFADKWKHPIESLTGNFGEVLVKDFEAQMLKIAQTAAPQAPSQVPGMAELLTAMTAMMKQNQELLNLLANPKQPVSALPEPNTARRA